MKRQKVFAAMLAMALVFGVASVHAQSGILGFKLGPEFGINRLESDMMGLMPTDYEFDEKSNVAFSLDIYGGYAFDEHFSLVGGLNFMFGQGMKLEGKGFASRYDTDLIYSSLDIPVLVRYTFINKPVVFGVQAGPHLSIPFGMELSGGGPKAVGIDDDYDSAWAVLGITLGTYLGYPLGPGKIVGDLRMLADFLPVGVDYLDSNRSALHRTAINLTFGYEFTIGKK
jgi:hypothetical protein